jgi:hypothetical protein
MKTAQSPACRARSSLPLAPIIGPQKTRPAADAKASALHTLDTHIDSPQRPTDSTEEPKSELRLRPPFATELAGSADIGSSRCSVSETG